MTKPFRKERMISIRHKPPTKRRTKPMLKKLSILRNAIIMSNYRDEYLRWEMVTKTVDLSPSWA